MYQDIRIRNANRSTPIPRGCRAYCYYDVYNSCLKVIISDSMERADRYFRAWAQSQGIDLSGWRSMPFNEDFDVVLADNKLPRI